MLVTIVISGKPHLMSQAYMNPCLQFRMVLANDTEKVSYFCQYINLFNIFHILLNRYLKVIC